MWCSKQSCVALVLTLGVLFSFPAVAGIPSACNGSSGTPWIDNPACNTYLQVCNDLGWMPKVTSQIATEIEAWITANPTKNWLDTNAPNTDLYDRAESMYKAAWSSGEANVNTSDAKSTSAGMANDTYLGLYNCLSPTGASADCSGVPTLTPKLLYDNFRQLYT